MMESDVSTPPSTSNEQFEQSLQTLRYNRQRNLVSPCSSEGASNINSAEPLPAEPLLQISPREPTKDYCEVCGRSWKKYKNRGVKMITVDKEAFKKEAYCKEIFK